MERISVYSLRKAIYCVGFTMLAWIGVSCRNGNIVSDNTMDLDSFFLEWEQKTDSIIARIHEYDTSSVYLMFGDTQPYGEHYYIKNGLFRERGEALRSALPILINTTDSILIIEEYDIEADIINVFHNGIKYSYQINSENHLPYRVSTKSANVSDVISSVERGYYVCFSQGRIDDFSCTTLMTKQDEKPKSEILALTINEILH